MYFVVNMGDLKSCNKSIDEYCLVDGRYQYNINVVFDDEGKFVVRYYKQYFFLNEMKVVDRLFVLEYIIFETFFGKFGIFICFDALFYDFVVLLVIEYKVDYIVFFIVWFDVFFFFVVIGFYGFWVRGMKVNFFGVNIYVSRLLNIGSGIYSLIGVKKYYRSLFFNGFFLVVVLFIDLKNMLYNIFVVKLEKRQEKNFRVEDFFYLDLFGDLFFFKEFSKLEGILDVCYNGSDICCFFIYKMVERRVDEMYVLGVFDGFYIREG